MKKKLINFILLIIVIFSIVACQSSASKEKEQAEKAEKARLENLIKPELENDKERRSKIWYAYKRYGGAVNSYKTDAATNIARAYYEELEDYKRAMEWIEYSNKIKPTAENSVLACEILDYSKKYEEAISWCTQAYELGNENSLVGIGLAYRGAKKYKEALKWLHLANEKNIPRSANSLGWTYSDFGDYVNAEKWFLQAVKDDPKHASAINNLVHFYVVDLKDNVRGAAYAIASINNVFPANTVAKFLIAYNEVPLEDLLKAYEFQLNNPILPYKYTDKERLGMLKKDSYIRLKKKYTEEIKREKKKKK